ncbi:MAG: hypothetical protein K0R54_5273 [Clostridiaceae bacterium]|nr:hypothetical protein [Clostridiaceae bacterium]
MNFKKKPIKYQFIIFIVFVYVAIIVMFSFTYDMVAAIITSKSKAYTIDMTNKIQSNISTYYDELKKITLAIAYNPYTQEIMKSSSPFEDYLLSKNLDKVFSNFKIIKSNISDIIVYSEEDNKYFHMSGEYQNDYFAQVIPSDFSDGEVHNTGFQKKNAYAGSSRDCFIYYTNIYLDTEEGYFGKKAGLVGVVVDNRQIFQEIEKISSTELNRYYLLDKNGVLLYNQFSNIKADEYRDIRNKVNKENIVDNKQVAIEVNGEKFFVYSTYIPEIECKLVSFIPQSEVFKELQDVENKFKIIFICAAIILAIPMGVLLKNILHPLNKLIAFMDGIKKGNLKYLKKKLQVDGYWEIIEMSNNFNDMLGEIDTLTHRLINTNSMLYEAELDKQKIEVSRKSAELAFLKSQINPHFLYNTLESMKGVAIDENAKRVFEMLKSLATIFSFSVKGTDFVTLEEEINIINAYAQIQIIRFGERVSIYFDIDESTKKIKIPKMILQPLVENSIFHGLEGLERNGVVKVSAFIEENTLVIKVEDNGIGIDKEKLTRLNEILASKDTAIKDEPVTSIGVENVNKRLKLIYGDQCGISIQSDYGTGTLITVKITYSEVNYV